MDEEEKRRITWFANKLVKKNVQLPFLRRPASGDQFSTLIESVDHLLTESHRKRELLLPELTAFNNQSVGVFSD